MLFLHIAMVHRTCRITPSFYGPFLEARLGPELLFLSSYYLPRFSRIPLSWSLGHQPSFSRTGVGRLALLPCSVCLSRRSGLVLCCVLSMCRRVLCRVLRLQPCILLWFQ